AEISSIQTRHEGSWLEWLYRADDFSPCDGWRGRAPWLWPAVGRSYAPRKLEKALRTRATPTDYDWEHAAKIYPMPNHGFAMSRAWRVVAARADESGAMVECALSDDAETRHH